MTIRAKLLKDAKSLDEMILQVAKEEGVDGHEVRQAMAALTHFLSLAIVIPECDHAKKLPKRIPGISKKLEARLIASL